MNKRVIVLIFLFLIAAFLRFYRLSAMTEFLGDQGRTGIIIWNAWTTKTLPLVGPSVLSGQHLGPFYYYFIAFPFLLSNFHPLAPAFWMAMFGMLSVLLMFYLGEKFFGFWISLAITFLYAISPYVTSSDRTLWEPNIIPFFVLLYIFLIYSIYQKRLFMAFLPLGMVVGVLVQLHYPNIFFTVLSFLFLFFLLATKKKQESLITILFWSFLGVAAFFIVLSPFLYYEAFHAWEDIHGIILIFFSSGSKVGKREFLHSFLDFSSRLFYIMFPTGKLEIMTIMKLGIIGGAIIRKKFWGVFFGLWFIAGIAAMSLYKGIVFDHYLNFLVPLPFFLFGAVMYLYNKYMLRLFWTFLVILAIIFQVHNLNINFEGTNDIARTLDMTSVMERLTSGKPFSFALISSRSFSDLHYRYFFTTQQHIYPLPLVDRTYVNLFLVCEKAPCPSFKEMQNVHSTKVICYDEYCGRKYPSINLEQWQLVATYDGFDSRLYIYRRKSLLNT